MTFATPEARDQEVQTLKEVHRIRLMYATKQGWTPEERELSVKYQPVDVLGVMLHAYDDLKKEFNAYKAEVEASKKVAADQGADKK